MLDETIKELLNWIQLHNAIIITILLMITIFLYVADETEFWYFLRMWLL